MTTKHKSHLHGAFYHSYRELNRRLNAAAPVKTYTLPGYEKPKVDYPAHLERLYKKMCQFASSPRADLTKPDMFLWSFTTAMRELGEYEYLGLVDENPFYARRVAKGCIAGEFKWNPNGASKRRRASFKAHRKRIQSQQAKHPVDNQPGNQVKR